MRRPDQRIAAASSNTRDFDDLLRMRVGGIVTVLALMLGACEPPAPPASWQPLPGAEMPPPPTIVALEAARQAQRRDEALRTRHLRQDGSPKYVNRLLLESSPYLRQHAHNPVNWYPWGDEAFETARRLGRPVLLSIGYSTCHWCHVMEEESFEDEEIARLLNERYVAIKVDREQRPDLDSIYMTAVQAITGRGGWPMTVWLTPDREPFHGGTYFPPRDGQRGAMPGFVTVLTQAADAYAGDAQAASRKAAELADRIRSALAPAGSTTTSAGSIDVALPSALAAAQRRFDAANGGPRGAPKFPSAMPLRALLRHHRRSGNPDALNMVTKTLEGMAAGGIRDHLGGGFHRYSVDANWLVPHFEKMLYDNALLAAVYVEAWQATGRKDFADVAREIFSWVEREMTATDGGFYSATDADSPAPDGSREEGLSFTWTPAETAAVLGRDESRLFDAAYGVTALGKLDGRSVLHLAMMAPDLARQFSASVDDVSVRLSRSRATLLDARDRRPPPLRDDKVLTSWNGLMISAAARASIALGEDRLRRLGARAADLVLGDFARSGRLSHSIVGDKRQAEAFLDDYANLEAGLLDLYEAGDGEERLAQALALDAVVENEFEDPAGGFFLTPADRSDLLLREKPADDGAEPSGNSIAILNLLRLAELTAQPRFRDRADRALAVLSDRFASSPLSVGDALLAADFASDSPKEIVLVTDGDRESLRPLLRTVGETFVPNRVLIAMTKDAKESRRLPLAEGKVTRDGQPTAYVCEARVCDLPTSDVAVLATQLRRARPLATAVR